MANNEKVGISPKELLVLLVIGTFVIGGIALTGRIVTASKKIGKK